LPDRHQTCGAKVSALSSNAEAQFSSADLDDNAPKRDGQEPKLGQLVQCTKNIQTEFLTDLISTNWHTSTS